MRTDPRLSAWLLLANAALLTTVLGLYLWGPNRGLPADELDMLRSVHRQILEHHIEEHDGRQLLQAAIAGMVQEVDAYSAFVPPDQVRAFENDTNGTYQGIGIVMADRIVPLTVLSLFEDGPAEKAGLTIGDEILAVDGQDMTGFTATEILGEARERLLGPPGTEVQLHVRRGGDEVSELDFTVRRGSVQQPSVHWARVLDRDARLGYLHLSEFQQRTDRELEQAVQALDGDIGGLRALVIDLRNNVGGLLDECLRSVNLFVKEGVLVRLLRRDGGEAQRHEADPTAVRFPDLPLVLLVNERSASAAEVMAGALRDHGHAQLVGARTYGKGHVQSIFVDQRLDFRLKLTTARYVTPNGTSIEPQLRKRGQRHGRAGLGLVPDRAVEIDDEGVHRDVDLALAGRDYPRRYDRAVRELAARLGVEVADGPLPPERDAQLAAAIEVARERADAAERAPR